MVSSLLYLGLFASLAKAGNFTAPPPTGPYTVGTTNIEIVDSSRQDPYAPTPKPRDLVAALYYPVGAAAYPGPRAECKHAIQFTPAVASFYEKTTPGVPSGILQNIVTQACVDAPLTQPQLPVLIFSPGLGGSKYLYSDTLVEIASYGWNIVAIDHPYETGIVQYPDGRIVYAVNASISNTVANVDIRAADMISVLNALSNSTVTNKIPGLKTRLRTDKVGVYGHSLGGATALRVTANDTRFVAGSNLDGSFQGTSVQLGTDAPFFVFAAQSHNRTNDASWAEGWNNLRGFKREYAITGVEHNNFLDVPLLRQFYGSAFPPDAAQPLGPLNGTRGMAIQRAYLNSFFQRFLKGVNDGLMDGVGDDKYPEVYVGV
ncbi:Alpha/Beta hydrolase protein [Hypoxylon trugodes]|uniref:Alpha/Beta hydrolase protein n=1 Tax=Hypoxylon trugodes TaxID=326681 RepID=UPI0021975666|nr:Alpha/Beta hydrolase protein [Hypoxylon trugodes]KAI1391656.1 Alpha/Beta hydrolase protein [Hypoxylon trugodes]